MGSLCVAAAVACRMPLGCAPPTEAEYRQFEDEDPDVRISAIRQAGNHKDRQAIGYLIGCLTDPERDVRFFAIVALEKIVGKETASKMGYQHFARARLRADAVDRWRQWWQRQHDGATTRTSTEGPS